MPAILKQEQNNDGVWFTWVYISDGESLLLTTDYQVLEAEALTIQAKHYDIHLYDSTPYEEVSIYEYRNLLKDAITYIKTENPTLTQWNNYLASLQWDEAIMVRWFLAMVARRLADRAEIDLSSYTETQVLAQLKTWIINAPARKIAKAFFNEI